MEYGSEIEFNIDDIVDIKNSLFKDKKEGYFVTLTESGRSALNHLLESLKQKYKKVLLPSYLCKAVYDSFKDFQKIYYEIDTNFVASEINLKNEDTEPIIVFVSNYFGLSQEDKIFSMIENIKKTREVYVIYDITHSFFSKQKFKCDAYIISIRKWFSIPDGGVLYAKTQINLALLESDNQLIKERIEMSILKSIYLKGNKDVDLNVLYRNKIATTENILDFRDFNDRRKMSQLSENYINYANISRLNKRTENYNVLLKNIDNPLIKKVFNYTLKSEQIPYVFPIYCSCRDKLRSYLIKNKVYCAIHWPNFEENSSLMTAFISANILSIPIDQRYSTDDMKNIANIVNGFKESANV